MVLSRRLERHRRDGATWPITWRRWRLHSDMTTVTGALEHGGGYRSGRRGGWPVLTPGCARTTWKVGEGGVNGNKEMTGWHGNKYHIRLGLD
jgi:hypothetical protein